MNVSSKWLSGALCAGLVFAAGCKKEEPAAPPPEEEAEMNEEQAPEAAALPEPKTPDVKVCELVPQDRLMELSGVKLAEGKVMNDAPGVVRCQYDRAAGDVMPGISIALQGGDLERAWEERNVMPGGQEVEGLGDKAMWHDMVKQLHVKTGQYVVTVVHPDPKLGREGAEKIAREVLEKL